jgi:hypothetical protein
MVPADMGAVVWWSTGAVFLTLAVAVSHDITTSWDSSVTHEALAGRHRD